ncbi:MAG: HlyD family efflux transporter periplasmic adaptor subunit [Eubacteriales bacterium]|nr:HlyD family efflux transporter periplasmic adaptor subunit [Eubacteriales bacterium]
MSSKAKKRGRLVLILLVLVGLGVGIYFLMNPNSGRMKDAAMEEQMQVSAIIIRNETVVQRNSDVYNLHFLVSDGDYVNSNQPIATAFARGYDQHLGAIIDKQQQIYTQQLSLLRLQGGENGLPAELTSLNAQIDGVISQLSEISTGERQADFIDQYDQLNELMEQRMTVMARLVTPDDALNNSISELNSLQSSFTTRSTIINESSEGYISFNLDGYEGALDPNQLNTTQITDLLSSNGLAVPAASSLYRITAANIWYVAFNVDIDSPQRLIQGQTYSIMQKGGETTYSAYCKSMRIFTTKITYVLEINADVAPVLNTRSGEFVIVRSAQGVSVALEGLIYTDGVPSLMVKQQGGGYIDVPVYILVSDENRAIVVAQDQSITLKSGLRYQIP